MFIYDPRRADFADNAFDIYRTLRDEYPVYHNAERGFWALSRYDDVRAAAGDAELFSSERTSIAQGLVPTIQSLDPPLHDELRNLVNRVFTARRIARMEPRIREIARDLIDGFSERDDGHCDVLRDFAAHLPSRVIGEMIGVPSERRVAFLEWTEALVAADPLKVRSDAGTKSAANIYQEFSKLLAERRAQPRDDLMSAMLEAELDGRRLTEKELLGFCFVLIVAGNDTTSNLIGNGAALLAHHPEQRAQLIGEPSRIPDAIEEILRYESPSQALPRIATRDITLHGVTIPKGEEVMLVFGAANHDEREFPNPEHFDIDRPVRRHVAFGLGRHFCIGSHLARLEAQIAFEELLARYPDYQLAAEPSWLTSVWARAYQSVPIRLG